MESFDTENSHMKDPIDSNELNELCRINEQISDESLIGSLDNIHILNLHGNQLQSLDIKQSDSVIELNISSNRFIKLSDLSHMPHLRQVDISGNQITSLLDLPYLPYLETISVAFNCLTSLDGLDGFPSLKMLDARGNSLSSSDAFTSIQTLSSLSDITLSNSDGRHSNPICSHVESILEVFDSYSYYGRIDGKSRGEWASQVDGKGIESQDEVSTPRFDAVASMYRHRVQSHSGLPTSTCTPVDGTRADSSTTPYLEEHSALEDVHLASSSSDESFHIENNFAGDNTEQWGPQNTDAHDQRRPRFGDIHSRGVINKRNNPWADSPPLKGGIRERYNRYEKQVMKEAAIQTVDVKVAMHEAEVQTECSSDSYNWKGVVQLARVACAVQSVYSFRHIKRLYIRHWRCVVQCAGISDAHQAMLQENSLVRLTAERASGAAESARSTLTAERARLERQVMEETRKNTSLRHRLVKAESAAQAHRKELTQLKELYRQLENKFTADVAAAEERGRAIVSDTEHRLQNELICAQKEISSKDQKLAEVSDELDSVKRQVDSLSRSLKEEESRPCPTCPLSNTTIAELRAQLEEALHLSQTHEHDLSRLARAESAVSELRRKCADLEKEKSDSHRECEKLRLKNESQNVRTKENEVEIGKLEKQLNKLASAFSNLRSENSSQADEIEKLQQSCVKHEATISEQRSLIHELKTVLRRITDRCRELESRRKTIEVDDEKRDLSERLSMLMGELEEAHRERDEAVERCSERERELSEKIESTRSKLDEGELSLRVKDKMIDDLNMTIRRLKDRHREEIERLTESHRLVEEEIRDEMADLENQLEGSKEEEKAAIMRVAEMEEEWREERSCLEQRMEEEIGRLTKALRERDADLESAQSELNSISKSFKDHIQSAKLKDDTAQKLAGDLAAAVASQNEYKNKFEAEKESRFSLLRDVGDLRRHVASLQKDNQTVVSELKHALKQKRSELVECHKKLQKMESLFSSLQDLTAAAGIRNLGETVSHVASIDSLTPVMSPLREQGDMKGTIFENARENESETSFD